MKLKKFFMAKDAEGAERFLRSLCVLLLGLLPVSAVLAHGGGELQVANAPIAAYQVSVWTNPPTARANQPIHVTVGVATAVSGEPVLDAVVEVSILNASGEAVSTAAATTEQSANRLFFEADLAGIPVGAYEVSVEVAGSEGSGMLTFPLEVRPSSIWPWLGGALVGLGAIWLVIRYWRGSSNMAVTRRKTAVPRSRSVD